MRQLNDNAIPLQAAASVNGPAIAAQNLFYCSAQIVAAGGGAGTFVIQASDDDFGTNPPVHWTTIASATVSGDGVYLIPKIDLCYQWIRLVYTNSGAGTISAVIKALGD